MHVIRITTTFNFLTLASIGYVPQLMPTFYALKMLKEMLMVSLLSEVIIIITILAFRCGADVGI